MKNFERISINSEKLLKNEELITLRGGVELEYCNGGVHCGVSSSGHINEVLCCISEGLMIEMRDYWASDPGNTVWWCCEHCETSSYCSVQS